MKLDLNLLRVFDILMEVRSVSRAADRLGLTQSAVSHALARLREQLDDPLFLRARGGLKPTARASEIAANVRDGLSLLRGALAHPIFDPATTVRTFTINASSYFCVTLLPIAMKRAREEAPLAAFRIVNAGGELLSGLDEGTIDLALGGFGGFPSRFDTALLYAEQLVWAGRSLCGAVDIDSRPRIAISVPRRPGVAEESVIQGALERRTAVAPAAAFPPGPASLTVHDALSVVAFVANSDLVALLPRQLALVLNRASDIDILEARDHDDVDMGMLWHARASADPAHMWLRDLLLKAAATLVGDGG